MASRGCFEGVGSAYVLVLLDPVLQPASDGVPGALGLPVRCVEVFTGRFYGFSCSHGLYEGFGISVCVRYWSDLER